MSRTRTIVVVVLAVISVIASLWATLWFWLAIWHHDADQLAEFAMLAVVAIGTHIAVAVLQR